MSLLQRKNKKIAQVLPSFAEKDAIGKQVLIFDELLKKMGFETSIYAQHFPKKFEGRIAKPEKIKTNDYLGIIYHHSIGDDVADFIKDLGLPILLYYHNITPPVYFKNYNERVYELLYQGRAQLSGFAKMVNMAVSASQYNCNELIEYGFENTDVFPIVFEPESLSKIEEDNELKKHLSNDQIVNVLFVGRYSPNKCHRDLIKAFYIYNKYFNAVSRLNFVGNKVEMDSYVHELNDLILRLGMDSTVVLNDIQDDTQWKTFYTNSNVFVSASEHEGFFVPALEANYFGLPLIAYDAGAVADTVGDAGILTSDKRPEVIAELINKVVTDENLKNELVNQGKENYKRFELKNIEDKFFEIINKFVGSVG